MYHVGLNSGAAPGERTIVDHTIWREGGCWVPRGLGVGEDGMTVPADHQQMRGVMWFEWTRVGARCIVGIMDGTVQSFRIE